MRVFGTVKTVPYRDAAVFKNRAEINTESPRHGKAVTTPF